MYQVSMTEVYWLAVGNLLYYVIGIALAAALKDNRAFCKYVCPIPTMQKVTARFAMLRMEIDAEKCIVSVQRNSVYASHVDLPMRER